MDDTPINHVFFKTVSALGVVFTIDLWTAVGKVCAGMYALVILGEWIWKRIVKPLAIHFGLIKTPNVIVQSEDV